MQSESPTRFERSFLDFREQEDKFILNIFNKYRVKIDGEIDEEALLFENFEISGKKLTVSLSEGYRLLAEYEEKLIGWVYVFYLKVTYQEDINHLTLFRGPQKLHLSFKDRDKLRNWLSHLNALCLKTNFEKKYTIEKILGKGGFAKVYSAKSNTNGERVAAKFFSKEEGATDLKNKVVPRLLT